MYLKFWARSLRSNASCQTSISFNHRPFASTVLQTCQTRSKPPFVNVPICFFATGFFHHSIISLGTVIIHPSYFLRDVLRTPALTPLPTYPHGIFSSECIPCRQKPPSGDRAAVAVSPFQCGTGDSSASPRLVLDPVSVYGDVLVLLAV